jgi:hypothetical protein
MQADFESATPLAVHQDRHPNKICYCHRLLVYGQSFVDLLHYPGRSRGGLKNLIACARGWICPVCGRKISERRRERLQSALSPYSDYLLMLTLTLSHRRSDRFVEGLGLVKPAYDKLLVTGRPARDFCKRWGIEGRLRALEVTYGINGPNVHMHPLLLMSRKWSEIDLVAMEAESKDRYVEIVDGLGGYASFEHGAVLSHNAALDYPAKMQSDVQIVKKASGGWTIFHEMTKSAVKQSRGGSGATMLELLAGSALDGINKGDLHLSRSEAGRIWLEYAGAFHRQQHLVPSGKLKGIIGKLSDLTDVQIEKEQVEQAVIMGAISRSDWPKILAHDVRGELCLVLGKGDSAQLVEFLSDYGVRLISRSEGVEGDE